MSEPRRDEPYRPLADYALIGNGRTAALVARDGSIDWCCMPRFDSPAVFCRILDARRGRGLGGGSFRVAPVGEFGASRRYVPSSNVLETVFTTGTGRVRLTDAMLAPPAVGAGGEESARTVIVRRIEGLAGRVELDVEMAPSFEYASGTATIDVNENEGVAVGECESLRLVCPGRVRRVEGEARGAVRSRLVVAGGEQRWVWLGHARGPEPPSAPGTAAVLEETLAAAIAADRAWAERCRYRGPHADLVRRSSLVLKLLTYEPTGALVAAPTTSLPEAIGGTRNWDYRYTWMRDAVWILDGPMSVGYHDEAMAFWEWLERLALGPDRPPAVLYTVTGEPGPPERVLEHLEGYRGSRPVRIGNAAAGQRQLDVFGEVVAAIHTCAEWMPVMHPLRPGLWSLVRTLADAAAAQWRTPDRGLWEVRGEPQHFLSSKLMCWVALDRAVRLAERDGLDGPLDRWRAERTAIREAILRDGYNPGAGAGGAFTQAFGSAALDASALLIPLVGFLPASDDRVRATVSSIAERLMDGGLVLRYLSPDGLPGGEGSFLLCTFWLIDNLALMGRTDEAWALFERTSGYASDLGLLSEEVDSAAGELLGNFPQGFTHLALIRSAARLGGSTPKPRLSRPPDGVRLDLLHREVHERVSLPGRLRRRGTATGPRFVCQSGNPACGACPHGGSPFADPASRLLSPRHLRRRGWPRGGHRPDRSGASRSTQCSG